MWIKLFAMGVVFAFALFFFAFVANDELLEDPRYQGFYGFLIGTILFMIFSGATAAIITY